ncbi:hypothetical protein JCM16814_30650 [Desulfobaculum senezii]
MPTTVGQSAHSVAERFLREPWRFDVWKAVWLMRAIHGGDVCADDPESERFSFASCVSFAFPASELQEVRGVAADALDAVADSGSSADGASRSAAGWGRAPEMPRALGAVEVAGRGTAGGKPALAVNFLGLAGAAGPLPAPYTDVVLERAGARDTCLRDFLDLFNNRLVALFYASVGAYRPVAGHDCHPADSPMAGFVFSLMGMGTPGLRQSPAPDAPGAAGVPDAVLLRHAALYGAYPKSAAGLERVVADAFGVPARVEEFRGAWLDIEPEDQTRLGVAGANIRLGENAVLGTRVWEQSAGVTLRLGPLCWEDYRALLPQPPGTRRTALEQLVAFYVGEGVDVHIALELAAPSAIAPSLGCMGDAWLGWSSFCAAAQGGEDRAPKGRPHG